MLYDFIGYHIHILMASYIFQANSLEGILLEQSGTWGPLDILTQKFQKHYERLNTYFEGSSLQNSSGESPQTRKWFWGEVKLWAVGKECAETETHGLWEPSVNWYKPTLFSQMPLQEKSILNCSCGFLLTPFPATNGEKCLLFLFNLAFLYVAKCLVTVLHLTDLLLRSCQQLKE